ncbi:hypothetical protein [Chengkuizengella axinellae]|uniref:Uncharacterized protein n=1 Tax=Chengkuizengella axinellae TaxID=3064388 RepID=A0ABT9IYG1_9BACL|nr:hypothetical protein [Chengkuizengella sp. 2205SS18-9]MDP5274187.1 hypothetical protein [Chengkuizengella sp. 2205SS18-9]
MNKNRKLQWVVIISLFVLSFPISAFAAGEPMSFIIDECDDIRVPYSSETHNGCVEVSGTVTLNESSAVLNISADAFVIEAPRGPDSPSTPPRTNESISAEWLLFSEDGEEKSMNFGGENVRRISELVEQEGTYTGGILTIHATLEANGGFIELIETFNFNLQDDHILNESGNLDRDNDQINYQIVPVGDSIQIDFQIIEGNAPINWILFDNNDQMVAWLDFNSSSQNIIDLIPGEQYRLNIYTWEEGTASVIYEINVTEN